MFCCRGCPVHKSVLWQFSRFFTTVIPDYRHIWLTQCGKFQVRKIVRKFLQSVLSSTFFLQLDVWRKIVFFIFTWLKFQNWQTNRMIILENRNWLTQLGTNLNPILDYSSVYIKWKKGLIQGCVKSVNRSGHVFETFLLTKNTYEPVVSSFICTMYYIIPVTPLFIKKETLHGNVIQKLCLFVRTPPTWLLKYNCCCCFSAN